MQKYVFLIFGTVFGFILSRAGATTYDFYAKLFLFQDMQLLWVIAVAGAVGIVGIKLLKSQNQHALLNKEPIRFEGKPYKSSLIPGSLIFGLGWGLAAACPGTVLAMFGEGKMGAAFTILGILVGTYLHGLQTTKMQEFQSKRSSGEPVIQKRTESVKS